MQCRQHRRRTFSSLPEKTAALVVNQVELVWMLSQIIQNCGVVVAFALLVLIGTSGRRTGREQPSTHLRAVGCGHRGAMSGSTHFAFERKQHLLGPSGTLGRDREQRIGNVKYEESISVRHVPPAEAGSIPKHTC